MRMLFGIFAAATIATLGAGCGSTKLVEVIHTRTVTATVTDTVTVAPPPVDEAAGDCIVYDYGTAQYLSIVGEGNASVCAAVAKNWSASGTFWTLQGQQTTDDRAVCGMRSGTVQITVYDDGSQFGGQLSCATLAKNGWQQIRLSGN